MTKDIWLYFALVFFAQMSRYRLSVSKDLRDQDMLLVADGHKTCISVLAAAIEILKGIDVLVLPPHSSHLIQVFDVGITPALKTASKNELEKRIKKIMKAPPGRTFQAMRMALVESFINAVHRGATPGNILRGFRKSDICPVNPMKPLRSQFTVEPPEPGIYHTVNKGAEINELVLTWPSGLDKLAQIEFGRPFNPLMERVNYRQAWEGLSQKTVVERRSLSSPPPFFVRLDKDPTMIKEIHIPSLSL
jgi:hypothetical protein